MVRTLISLPDQELKRLDVLARKNKKSRAQLVREAVDLYLKKHDRKQESWKEIVRQTAGIWKHKKIDTDTYLGQLRAEWNR